MCLVVSGLLLYHVGLVVWLEAFSLNEAEVLFQSYQ